MKKEEIFEALKILGLVPPVSLKDIKERYRELSKRYHPDVSNEVAKKNFADISSAYRLLREYCENFRFQFTEEEILSQFPDERIRSRFKGGLYWLGE
jgi:DnaJ-class molecular chaperone